MSKSYGQRLKILYVLDILRKHSDEAHPLTATEICKYLEGFDITAERKSVYKDIEALIDYGEDIVYSSSPKGYFLASREFEEPEIYLLADAVRSAKFITPKKTRELVKKLDSMLGEGGRKKRQDIYFDFSAKCSNEEIFYNIDKISNAIADGKKLCFDYVSRELDGRKFSEVVKRRKISPYALVWQDDHYYLIGNYEKYDNLLHLRLDRIQKVEITDEKSRFFGEVSEYKESFDVADYTAKIFGMFSGELETVELRCNKTLANTVADRFGEKIFITGVTESEFCFSFKGALSKALVTFIMNYGDDIEVIKPDSLKKKVIERAQKILEMYKN